MQFIDHWEPEDLRFMICNAVANMLMVKGGKTKIENMASIVDGFM